MNKTGTRTIETHRLLLRRFEIADAEDMYRNWASDPAVTRFLTWPAHASADVSRQVLANWISRYEDGGFFNWAIHLKETGAVIGNIAVVKLNEKTASADIGYCLGRAFWGRGIMPEALRAVMDYLFDTVELGRVAACHDVNNPNSGRVMQKAGMRFEGIFRHAGVNNIGICDEAWYALLRGDRTPPPEKRNKPVRVRFARAEDLERVNELRMQVNELHVLGKPDVFRPGFCAALRDYVYAIFNDTNKRIAVAERQDGIVGFAVLNHIVREENPFMYKRDFLDVDEFGVDEACRRQGVAAAMMDFIRGFAAENGYGRIELNMWEFNRGALAFYEAAGFKTFRRYMEVKLSERSIP